VQRATRIDTRPARRPAVGCRPRLGPGPAPPAATARSWADLGPEFAGRFGGGAKRGQNRALSERESCPGVAVSAALVEKCGHKPALDSTGRCNEERCEALGCGVPVQCGSPGWHDGDPTLGSASYARGPGPGAPPVSGQVPELLTPVASASPASGCEHGRPRSPPAVSPRPDAWLAAPGPAHRPRPGAGR
jgi:hypothetical protein